MWLCGATPFILAAFALAVYTLFATLTCRWADEFISAELRWPLAVFYIIAVGQLLRLNFTIGSNMPLVLLLLAVLLQLTSRVLIRREDHLGWALGLVMALGY